MRVEIKPGKYILAVSGGVDSMVLLHLLAQKQKQVTRNKKQATQFQVPSSEFQFVVAHFNHGIRRESGLDEEFVRQEAERLGLECEVGHGNLGSQASEEAARKSRYDFLKNVQAKRKAKAIITAHHQDDLIETAFINLLRGTGPRGLVAIASNSEIIRPLLNYSKQQIYRYATKHNINWREDQSNHDESYLRNYVRKNLMSEISAEQRGYILKNLDNVAKNHQIINKEIATLSQYIFKNNQINRTSFANLPVDLSNELVTYWLRRNHIRDYDKKTVNRLNIALKTAKPNTICDVQGDIKLLISQKSAKFTHRA